MKNVLEFTLFFITAIMFYGFYFYYVEHEKKKILETSLKLDPNDEVNDFELRHLESKPTPNATEYDVIVPHATYHGFHDHFAKKNGFETNHLLGWRYWFLRNKSNYQVEPTNNFKNIPLRQYLDNMDSVENWFYNIYDE